MTDDRNAAVHAREARHERARMLGLALPALAVIGAAVVVPILWVLYLSVLDVQGHFTLGNYLVLATEGANLSVIVTTLKVSLLVTVVSVVIGYPLTYLLAQLPPSLATICMLGILLPYMTSVLVRTYAWMVLLGRRGIVNTMLVWLGITDAPLQLMFNTTATVIGMVHVMVPLLALPLYATMRAIDHGFLRAAASLGAGPVATFWRVYFPLSLPGLSAGTFLIFVTSLGFFITPTVLGGGRVTMIGQQIATAIATYDGFGVATALGVGLLAATAILLGFAMRVLRLDLMRAP
ncbi:ABC transporter permease [Limobrevibacterium gyesilva]|uniref:ABC transporter permease n=1 Tax=Limobrevibacterium gyesilva TaxID=2991712 RepID=A0AA41YV36_9PROT|nr:ABC transporter permease [Limobrevibacterium gyesilva]MCW3477098.1 ABC transporter permease [Limobrevibacterium gyesilva]